jgi:Flp pilus assembly protein TadD
MATAKDYIDKAEKFYKKRNFEKAIYWFSMAISKRPDDADLFSERAVAHFHNGSKKEALLDLDRAQELEPMRAYRYSSRAYIKDSLGDVQGAIEDYKKAIELDPEDAIAYNNLGLLEEKLGYANKAKVLFDFADELAARSDSSAQGFEQPENLQKKIDQEKSEKTLLGEAASVFKSKESFKEFITFIRNGFK